MRKLAFFAVLGALLALGNATAHATLLTIESAGAAPSASNFNGTGWSVVQDSGLIPLATPGGTGNNVGTLEEAVLQISGSTDYVYQITSNSSQGVQSVFTEVELSGYGKSGLIADYSYSNSFAGVVGTATHFLTANQSGNQAVTNDLATWVPASGAEINITNALGIVQAASNQAISAVLIIATNSPTYTTTTVSVQDGGSENLPSEAGNYTLWAPVPEPTGTAALCGLGIMGGMGLVFRRKRS